MRRRRLILGVLAVAVIASFAAYLRRPGDLANYVAVGNAALDGRDLYLDTPPGCNTWPPFFSYTAIPLALLDRISPYAVRAVWIALNWLAIYWCLDLIARLLYGKRMALHPGDSALAISSPELLIPFALTIPYLVSNLELLQINTILLALVLWGLYLQANGRDAAGGIALAAASVMKVMAVVFLPYLIYRKRWRAAFWMAGAAAIFFLSPILVLGWAKFWKDVAIWPGVLRGSWGSNNLHQSVYSMWDRILGYGFVPFAVPGFDYQIPMSGASSAKLAWLLTCAVVGIAGLLAFRGAPLPASRWAQVEWGAVLVASTILSPLTRKPYLVVLLLPNALLYAAWRSAEAGSSTRRIVGGVLAASFVLSLPTLHDLIGKSLAMRLEMGSVVTYGALIMLAGLLWYRRRAPLRQGEALEVVTEDHFSRAS